MAIVSRSAAGWLLALAFASTPRAQAETSVGTSQAPAVSAAPVAWLDTDIRDAVSAELRSDHHIVASGIEVGVRGGIVELRGTVTAMLGRQRATAIASVVHGVRAVVNRVEVVVMRRPDARVESEVRAALGSTPALAKMPIRVRAADGVVELTGSISSWDEQQLAERVASGVAGVRFCQNDLSWRRSIRRSSTVIKADIQSRLAWDPLVEHARFRVSARGTRVTIAGTVGSALERRRAIALASVKSVTSVDASALIIDSKLRPDANLRSRWPTDGEIADAIHSLGPEWTSFGAQTWTSAVVDGVVSLRGTVPTRAEEVAIEGMVRSVVGVTDVRNELSGPWGRTVARPLVPGSLRSRGR